MKSILLLLLLFLFTAASHAQQQAIPDTATIVIRNVSRHRFHSYHIVIRGEELGGVRLKPGKSHTFKIPVGMTRIYRFRVYLDRNRDLRHDIDPMDYTPTKVEHDMGRGAYLYNIGISEGDDYLTVEVIRMD